MRSNLPAVAREVGVAERTLRRAVARGAVRASRRGPRQFDLGAGERIYLQENWELLSAVAEALRTERNVRLAVVFGSVAQGTAGSGSDLDLMVSLEQERSLYLAELAARLTRALGRNVDLLCLKHVRDRDPGLLAAILRDGRAVIDRERAWPTLLAERGDVERAAAQARAARHRRSMRAVADLIGVE